MNSDNPFAKNESLNIGKEVAWKIDKKSVLATKTTSDSKGDYYHLQYDNNLLKLFISSDSSGNKPKEFSQLEIKNVSIDAKQSPVFNWCLNNQERHNRFLQQGLTVKKNICTIDGNTGTFVMQLNKETLKSLQQGRRLSIMLKPYRTSLSLNYDISDFKDMHIALNAKAEPAREAVVKAPAAEKKVVVSTKKKCWAGPPVKYKGIKSVEYDCDDVAAKKIAEARVIKLVNKEKARDLKRSAAKEKQKLKQKKLNAEKERKRKLAKEKKKKIHAEKAKRKEMMQAEAAAIAASEAKQAELGSEITQKMLTVCEKLWKKGEHRCYCQKYIEHAPSDIQAKSTCN